MVDDLILDSAIIIIGDSNALKSHDLMKQFDPDIKTKLDVGKLFPLNKILFLSHVTLTQFYITTDIGDVSISDLEEVN